MNFIHANATLDARFHDGRAQRRDAVELLNSLLCSASDLHQQTIQAQWNVRSALCTEFRDLLFDAAKMLTSYILDVAERVASLDGLVVINARFSMLAAQPSDAFRWHTLQRLAYIDANFGRFGNALNEALQTNKLDCPTANLLSQFIEEVDKIWMQLRSSAQQETTVEENSPVPQSPQRADANNDGDFTAPNDAKRRCVRRGKSKLQV